MQRYVVYALLSFGEFREMIVAKVEARSECS